MAWHKFLVAGLVGSVAIAGCTVTTTTDKSDGALGGDTDSGTGGKATGSGGGTGSGGKATGGGTGSGGKVTGSGGAADVDAGPQFCAKCLAAKCAPELADCKADDFCYEIKTTHAEGEFQAIEHCMWPIILNDSGVGFYTEADLAQCAGDHAAQGSSPSAATIALITCARGMADSSTQPCTDECFLGPIPFN